VPLVASQSNMKKSVFVQIEDKKVEIKKLPIGQYAEILKALKELPKHFRNLEGLKPDKVLELLPGLIGSSMPDVVRIISIASDLPESEIEKMGLVEVTKLVEAIYSVNDFAEVYNIIKKAVAHQSPTKSQENQSKV